MKYAILLAMYLLAVVVCILGIGILYYLSKDTKMFWLLIPTCIFLLNGFKIRKV